MPERRRSWWGWGWEDAGLTSEQAEKLRVSLSAAFDRELPLADPPDLTSVDLRGPRVSPPESLSTMMSSDAHDRAGHTYGKSYRDVVRGSRGFLSHPPDLVAFPTDEAGVVEVLDWCSSAGVAVVPYGGGSTVVGGVECDVGDGYEGVVSLDLTRLDRVLEIDAVSRAARIQAGALGPVLEDQLRPHGYTLRHFPQSFEFSTLGGWLATRSGGHYASVYTHIDDMVESMRVVTPTGVSESRRLPGSGAGPSPDRMILGSEGALGVITEAWMRIQARPVYKTSAGVHFADYSDGVEATRAISQSALFPTNCRLLDSGEAMTSAGVGDGSTLLVLGFESADHPCGPWMQRALEICAGHRGTVPEGVTEVDRSDKTVPEDEGSVGEWRNAFIRAPYGRDVMVRMSVIADTFETACTWDTFGDLHDGVMTGIPRALQEICGSGGWVTCRFTHVYPDGPAPYFTVVAPGRPGSEVAMWDEIKAAAAEIVLSNGGTITHHHAVGRDHMPWYTKQRPEPFGRALAGAKSALDPEGVMNPGVLVPAGSGDS